MTKRITKPTLHAHVAEGHHWFATSAGEWRTGTDLDALLRRMKASNLAFSLWLVPGPETASYRIAYYAPQVEGAKQVAFYDFE